MRERIAGVKRGVASWRVIAAGGVAALAGCLLAVAVAAHTTRYASSVQLHAFTNETTNNYFYGVVSSPNSRCAGDRKVRIYRKAEGADPKFGSDVSQQAPSGDGPYTVTAPTGDIPTGSYYSQAAKRDLRPGPRHAHICKGARSSDLDVGP
jgi:hypothetical protein